MSRRTSSANDDSGFHSQAESINEQIVQLLNRLLESENLSEENNEAVNAMKEMIQSRNDFSVDLEGTCSFDDIIGHEGTFLKLSRVLHRILMEHIQTNYSLDSQLQIYSNLLYVPLEFVLENTKSSKKCCKLILTYLYVLLEVARKVTL